MNELMNELETIGAFLAALVVTLAGLKCMAASYEAGLREGRRLEASRQLSDVIEEANK